MWKFRGPKPFPILEDPRLDNAEKAEELTRVMKKLHLEFFIKKKMGHSRLHHARRAFYKAVADYATLTGKSRPDHVELAELPVLKKEGGAELQLDADGEQSWDGGGDEQEEDDNGDPITSTRGDEQEEDDNRDPITSTHMRHFAGHTMANGVVGDDKPECLNGCQIVDVNDHGHSLDAKCAAWDSSLTSAQQCTCLSSWAECAQQTCQDIEENDLLTALRSMDDEKCVWPQDKILGPELMAEKFNAEEMQTLTDKHESDPLPAHPDDDNKEVDADTPGDNTLMQSAADSDGTDTLASWTGLHLRPLLETNDEDAGPTIVGRNNPPTGCRVSHPDMLGDGNCDGGSYNTKACNYDGGDCCDSDCRPALHKCGVKGFKCIGKREGIRVKDNFKCDKGKMPKFTDYFEDLRDRLTTGDAMVTGSACSHLTDEEHQNIAQGFNLGLELGYYKNTQSAAAQKGGPEFYIDCTLWEEQMGNPWFGTLVTHELGHLSGYSHPDFKQQTYVSECEDIGSKYCQGHCMEWTKACENHAVFGSQGCGFAGCGCQTTCVHSDYCFSLPERLTECFGYMKVHSRAESLSERGYNMLSPFSWMWGGAYQRSLALPFVMACLMLART